MFILRCKYIKDEMIMNRLRRITQFHYIMTHPLAFWFSLGIFFVGLITLLYPHLGDETALSIVLPDWLETLLRIGFVLGGGFSVVGIVSGKSKFEAAGMAILSSDMITNFLVVVDLRPNNAATAFFLITLAIGCAQRSVHLTKSGYLG